MTRLHTYILALCLIALPSLAHAWGVSQSFGSGIHCIYELSTDVKLQLHFNEVTLPTYDSSNSNHTVSAVTQAGLATFAAKFGESGGTLTWHNDGGHFAIADSDDFNFADDAFSISTYINFYEAPIGTQDYIYSQYGSGVSRTSLYYDPAGPNLVFYAHITTQGTTGDLLITSSDWTPEVGRWYHIAVIRGWSGTTTQMAMTIDGTPVATQDVGDYVFQDAGSTVYIGSICLDAGSCSNYLGAYLDEYRVTKGSKAPWTSEFIPPPKPYCDE